MSVCRAWDTLCFSEIRRLFFAVPNTSANQNVIQPTVSNSPHDICNSRALAIWREHAEVHRALPSMHLMPLVRGAFQAEPELLFVGMNPSMMKEEPDDALEEHLTRRRKRVPAELKWDAELNPALLQANIDKLIAEEVDAPGKYHRYYKPLRDFAKIVDAKPEYLDMFLMRHTRQAEVLGAHWKDKVFTPPAAELFQLFKETLRAIAPKVVLIANAGASNIALKLLPLTTKDKLVYGWSELPGVPFFLSGMLSGQRAMDTFSRERLAANVRTALLEKRGGSTGRAEVLVSPHAS